MSVADRIEQLQAERDALKVQAQIHAGEARAANHTIGEIYQLVTGAKGEPGNWNGSIPVRQYIAGIYEAIRAARAYANAHDDPGQINALLDVIERAVNPSAEPGSKANG